MHYLFILGRNLELSKQEIFSYLKKTENKLINFSLNENGLLIEVEKPIDKNAIDSLGGIISIGEIIVHGKQKEILEKIESQTIYSGIKNNITFALWDFSNNKFYSQTLDYLKKRFRSEKLRASQKQLSSRIRAQDEHEFSVLSSKLVDLEFFVFQKKDEVFIGKITQKCDYKSLEKRDMEKPVRREELSISPRLAKIMINLSEAKTGQILLDSFCGIGVFLQEALLQNIIVIGIDSNKDAISGARQNLQWFKFNQNNYKLIKEDSKTIKISKVNSLVTEPDFGPILKKSPTIEETTKIMNRFEELIISVLNNLKNSVENRFVFTAPYIKLHNKKRIGCNLKRILSATNLRLVAGFPINEFRESQIVGRQIVVLEK